jgi:hypothetical protein
MILQRIGVLSGAKVFGAVYAGMGLVVGCIFSLFAMLQGAIMGAASEFGGMGGAFGMLFGVGAIVLFPIFYGVLGFLVGALGAFIYNLVSGFVGGLELTMAEKPGSAALGMSSTPPAMG